MVVSTRFFKTNRVETYIQPASGSTRGRIVCKKAGPDLNSSARKGPIKGLMSASSPYRSEAGLKQRGHLVRPMFGHFSVGGPPAPKGTEATRPHPSCATPQTPHCQSASHYQWANTEATAGDPLWGGGPVKTNQVWGVECTLAVIGTGGPKTAAKATRAPTRAGEAGDDVVWSSEDAQGPQHRLRLRSRLYSMFMGVQDWSRCTGYHRQ
eukprot:841582-Prorocentrum_minimum.AAC.6